MNFFAFTVIFSKGICFLVGIVFLLLAYKVFKSAKYQVLLRDVKLPEKQNFIWPKVSLIIPVCNEAQTVEKAAHSLFSMNYPEIEFIFVNDRSTDDTGLVLARLATAEKRMKIITISHLPVGWLGKVHAFKKGLEIASGEWILFSDADVHYNEFSLKKALSYSYNNKLDFLAVLPSIVGGTLFVRILLAQVIHYMTFLVNFSKISDPEYKGAIAHGAFMLVRTSIYKKSKGLEALKMEVLDDVGFAVEMKRAGAKIAILSGLDEIEFEWYSSTKGFINGFEKNGFASMQYSIILLSLAVLGMSLFFLGYTIFPIMTHSVIYMSFVWSSLIIYLLITQISLKKIIKIPFWGVFLFTVNILFLPYVVARSAVKCLKQQGIYWRGTFYPLAELKKAQRFKILKVSSQ